MKKILVLIILFSFFITTTFLYNNWKIIDGQIKFPSKAIIENLSQENTSSREIVINEKINEEIIIPEYKLIDNDYHVFQTFNNCGPAALSMALSYYDIYKSQEELGRILRPYQNSSGNNDDKSVTLSELAQEGEKYNLVSYHRSGGSIDLIKKFISYDIPVITRTRSTINDDIGHYRVIKGFDDKNRTLIQDDSLQGHNLNYKYDDFNYLWKMFNYEFLIFVPNEKIVLAENILGNKIYSKIAWEDSLEIANKELLKNPNDIFATLNASIANYYLGNYPKSVSEFEKVKDKLPKRTLWYQIEPILAYYEIGNYNKVFEISDQIFNNGNKAYSELYLLRGEIYEIQGDKFNAKKEYEKALMYNKNYLQANEKLKKYN